MILFKRDNINGLHKDDYFYRFLDTNCGLIIVNTSFMYKGFVRLVNNTHDYHPERNITKERMFDNLSEKEKLLVAFHLDEIEYIESSKFKGGEEWIKFLIK